MKDQEKMYLTRQVEVMERVQLCEDLNKEFMKHFRILCRDLFDEVGHRYGELLVIRKAQRTEVSEKVSLYVAAWKCVCDCGDEFVVTHQKLISGAVTHCENEVHESYVEL